MAHLELVPNKQTCWFCEEAPATSTRTSIVSGKREPCCDECLEIAQILQDLHESLTNPINLSDLCMDIALAPFKMRGGKLDS